MLHGLTETSITFTPASLITRGHNQLLFLELKLVEILFYPQQPSYGSNQ